MTTEEASRQVVLIEPDDQAEARALAARAGVEVVEIPPFKGGVDPATVGLLLIGLPATVAAVGQEIERLRGGQVFDLRPGAARPVYRSRQLTYGLITVYAADGSVQITSYKPTTILAELTAALTQLSNRAGDKTTASVRETVESLPGGDGWAIEISGEGPGVPGS